jgi:pimeloyl-ACP methyl ester carboxylesterase
MRTATFTHAGIAFRYAEAGDPDGLPFVFQHGLGGDLAQPTGLYSPPSGVRLLALDCRAHGETPVGDPRELRFDAFADDIAALLDHLGVGRAAIGGISMGAATACAVALRHPARVLGLALSRPAWLDGPMPAENVRAYAEVAALLRRAGPRAGRARFEASAAYRRLAARSSDAATSMLRQFDSPRARDAVVRLERLPLDRPFGSLAELAAVVAPAVVLAHGHDPVHPLAYGHRLAAAIPGARFVELTPKSLSPERHAAEVQAALDAFLAGVAGESPPALAGTAEWRRVWTVS